MFKKSLYPLLPKKYDFGKRRGTFRKTLKLLKEREAKVLVETGTARNGIQNTRTDGASTIVFGTWAKEHNARLYSIDHDASAIAWAQKEIINLDLDDHVEFVNAESTAFLSNFEHEVDFIYLDSMDYDKRDKSVQLESQEHHLREFRSIEKRLHDNSVVLIDDCRLSGGGKGKLAIEHMLKRGWKVMTSSYQSLLIKSKS